MENLDQVIKWLEEIKKGNEPALGYHLHFGIRALINSLGIDGAIKFFTDIKNLDK